MQTHVLALETTASLGSVALLRDEAVAHEIRLEEGLRHGRSLLPACEECLRRAGMRVRDLAAVEASGVFRGLYHVLTGALSPLDGVGPEHLTLEALARRVKSGRFTEVILATNPTLEGDGTALAAASAVEGLGVKVTRIAVGVPSGSFLEHSSKSTLAEAMAGRRDVR